MICPQFLKTTISLKRLYLGLVSALSRPKRCWIPAWKIAEPSSQICSASARNILKRLCSLSPVMPATEWFKMDAKSYLLIRSINPKVSIRCSESKKTSVILPRCLKIHTTLLSMPVVGRYSLLLLIVEAFHWIKLRHMSLKRSKRKNRPWKWSKSSTRSSINK